MSDIPSVNLATRHEQGPDDGFTLIELLVVTMIIGILAAVAIPTFLAQTRRGFEAQMKTSLRSLAINEESYMANSQTYGTIAQVVSAGGVIARSPDVTLTVVKYDLDQGYCLQATHKNMAGSLYWDSKSGGLQPFSAGGCPLVTTGISGDSLP